MTEDIEKYTTTLKNLCNRLLKSIIFILIFCMIWHYCFSILWVNKNAITYFYDEPKNSLDVIYIGSSNAYTHFNTSLAYNLYGYTTGMLATDVQPFSLVENFIKEARKYQSPKLYIIDLVKLVDDLSSYAEGDIRRSTDSMKFSLNRIEAINKVLGYANTKKSDYINYYISFLLYHNRWKNVTELSFKDNTFYKGYWFHGNTAKAVAYKKYIWNDKVLKLQDKNKEILLNLISYIKDNNLDVLFIIPIRVYDEARNGRLNDVISILKENNLEVINFNTLDDFGVDFSTDLYNEAHLNVYGATKYTLYFSKYLKDHYDLPDHRNDEKYNSWESEYERYKQEFKKVTNKNFDDLLIQYQ